VKVFIPAIDRSNHFMQD